MLRNLVHDIPIFSQIVGFCFPENRKIFPLWEYFPNFSQNIPKQDFIVFLNNPIFSQKFSLQFSRFVHRRRKFFPMWDFFPAISQNIPKQEFNVFLNNPIFSQKFSSVGFPFCPQAGKIISHLGYFSCYFPKYPKSGFQ